ncbi:uncharacterized protein LOC132698237 [Cylas formicarius]|uniref:uncharacterized protein LOC132698237 n=1 Tax=Cylas formicarius TaxID=197179 RepID=UPI0029586CA6|nr:uncharacterized protein LOC132698237 [Cylas formicarius]
MLSKSVFLLAAVLISQGFAVETSSADGAKDEVKKLYNELLEYMGTAISNANSTLNEALDLIKQEATQLETSAKESIQGALDSFQKEIDEINAKAKEKGINLEKCAKYETQFKELPDTLMDELLQCVNSQISTAQGYITDGMNRAQAIQTDLASVGDEIDNCGSGLKQITCLAKLSAKIESDIVESPKKISDDVTKTKELIQNLGPNIENCATGSVEKVPGQAGDIVKQFALCAAL